MLVILSITKNTSHGNSNLSYSLWKLYEVRRMIVADGSQCSTSLMQSKKYLCSDEADCGEIWWRLLCPPQDNLSNSPDFVLEPTNYPHHLQMYHVFRTNWEMLAMWKQIAKIVNMTGFNLFLCPCLWPFQIRLCVFKSKVKTCSSRKVSNVWNKMDLLIHIWTPQLSSQWAR